MKPPLPGSGSVVLHKGGGPDEVVFPLVLCVLLFSLCSVGSAKYSHLDFFFFFFFFFCDINLLDLIPVSSFISPSLNSAV